MMHYIILYPRVPSTCCTSIITATITTITTIRTTTTTTTTITISTVTTSYYAIYITGVHLAIEEPRASSGD